MRRSMKQSLPSAAMLKVVFDTVIFVRSLINPHSICGRLVFSYFDRYRLFVSEPVVREMLGVLGRPELSKKFRSLENLDMRQLFRLLERAEAVELSETQQLSRDPGDDKFLATAKAAGADYLVTEDKDLLVIEAYGGVLIVRSEQFLAILAEPT